MIIDLSNASHDEIMQYADIMVGMYVNDKKQLYDIAREFNLASSTVYKAIKEKTRVKNIRHLRLDAIAKDMYEYYKKVKNLKFVAEKFNCSVPNVYMIFRKRGYELFKNKKKQEDFRKKPKPENPYHKWRTCRICGSQFFGANILYCDECFNKIQKQKAGAWWDGRAVQEGHKYEGKF